MKQVVADAERLMALFEQAVPKRPQLTKVADLYFGDRSSAGFAHDHYRQMRAAWIVKDDAELLEHGIRTIANIVCGLRSIGFPVEEAWAAYVSCIERGAVPDERMYREVLDGYGFRALAALAKNGKAPI